MIISELFSNPIIRSLDLTDTFHQEDTMTLTEEEKREAGQLQMEERLRRTNPLAWENMKSKKRAEESEMVTRFLATRPGGDASHALIHFQSTQGNRPERSDIPTAPQAQLHTLTRPLSGSHPAFHPVLPYTNTFPISYSSPHDPTSSLVPIPGSSTQVQTTDAASPDTIVNTGQEDVRVPNAATFSPGPSSPSLIAKPGFENILAGEAEKMAQGKKT